MTTSEQAGTGGEIQRPRRGRGLWAVLGGAVLLGAGGLVLGMRMNAVPANLDVSVKQATAHGLYRVAYVPQGGSIPINRLHSWTLKVSTPDGQPLKNASIVVDGDMPQHGHGLPTSPQVSSTGAAGEYRVDGMKFQMPGWWVMNFTVRAGAGEDTARFNLLLK